MRNAAAALLLAMLCLPGAAPPPPAAFDFRYDILPILHRQGCGSAYCHGSATGRGGFRLSLFGSDPRADYAAITADLDGRRLDLGQPRASLLLRKPSLALAHGGGLRLRSGGKAYAGLSEWIDRGAPGQTGNPGALVGLKLERAGDRLRVEARFDGPGGSSDRDVTDLSTFSSSDERVATIDRDGRLALGGRGRAWIFARYVNQTARLAVVEPFAPAAGSATGSATAPVTLDGVWRASLCELGLEPGPPSSAATLARRLHLHLVDRLPTPAELRAFDPLAIDRTAAALMRTPEFAQRFGRLLAEWFEIPPPDAGPRAAMHAALRKELVTAVAANQPLHEIGRRFLVSDRRILESFGDPRDRAEWTGRTMLGIRIGCARCHDSPVDTWEQADHLGFSALFADPRPRPGGGMDSGKLFHPDTGRPITPRLLPVGDGQRNVDGDPAANLARFVFATDHRMFARNIANRVVSALLGRGLVEPLDDHRPSNPAVHEAVLDHLTELAGDLRVLVLHIVTSQLFQVESAGAQARAEESAGVDYFARRMPLAMPAATYRHAVSRALGVGEPESLPDSPLARQLALLNSGFLHASVERSPILRGIVSLSPDPDARLTDLFALLLSRPPRAAERAEFTPGLLEDTDGVAVRDLAYALLSCREFSSIR